MTDTGRHPDWGPKTEEAWEAARTEFGISSSHPLLSPALPVPSGTVAVLRLPMPVDGLVELMPALAEAYGPDLVIVTDAGLDGWMVVARKDDPEDLDSVRARRAAGGR